MNFRVGSKYQRLIPADCPCCAPEVQSILRKVDATLSRRGFLAGAAAVGSSLITGGFARGADGGAATMFANVNVFTGKSLAVLKGMSVLVRDGMIAGMQPGKMQPPDGATGIDGGGRMLMPGLIDNHVHIFLSASSEEQLSDPNATPEAMYGRAFEEAKQMLSRNKPVLH